MSQVNTRSTQRGQWILGGGGGSLYWGDRSQFLSGGSHNFDGRSPNRGGGSKIRGGRIRLNLTIATIHTDTLKHKYSAFCATLYIADFSKKCIATEKIMQSIS